MELNINTLTNQIGYKIEEDGLYFIELPRLVNRKFIEGGDSFH